MNVSPFPPGLPFPAPPPPPPLRTGGRGERNKTNNQYPSQSTKSIPGLDRPVPWSVGSSPWSAVSGPISAFSFQRFSFSASPATQGHGSSEGPTRARSRCPALLCTILLYFLPLGC